MGANSFGNFFTVTTFGESRSAALGAVIDGCPAGIELTEKDIQIWLDRRKPRAVIGNKEYTAHVFSTHRDESDVCEILSGVYEGKTLGSPIAVLVRNSETSSKNYDTLKDIYRPSHADYAYETKFGIRDYRGGGRASGRETIGRVIGGAVAKKVLDSYLKKMIRKKIKITIWAEEIAGIKTGKICENDVLPQNVLDKLLYLSREKDSAGCILTGEILNVPEGLGSPVFNKLDAVLAQALMSIGGVKAVEIGNGFKSAALTGSKNNNIEKNYSGGIAGGISAAPLPDFSVPLQSRSCTVLFRLAVKPPPSIGKIQTAFNSAGEKITFSITGEHDICLFPRIVPVVEAMVYLTIMDAVAARFDLPLRQ